MNTADKITIESDDRGFELHVRDEDGDWHVWNIHGIAEEVYDEVKRKIGPWLQERDAARSEYDSGVSSIPELQPILNRIKGLDPEAWKDVPGFHCDDPEGDWIELVREGADLERKRAKGE